MELEKPAAVWAKVRRAIRAGALTAQIQLMKLIQKRAADAAAAIRAGAVVIEEVAGRTDVTKQGDITMYSDDAVLARHKLMMTPEILASVKKHFVVLTGHKPVGRQWVTKEQYTRYFMLCYEVLYPDSDMTQEEQREALQEEWERDRAGLPALTFKVFYRAVFELVDQWCSTVDARDYVGLIENVFGKVKAKEAMRYWITDDDPKVVPKPPPPREKTPPPELEQDMEAPPVVDKPPPPEVRAPTPPPPPPPPRRIPTPVSYASKSSSESEEEEVEAKGDVKRRRRKKKEKPPKAKPKHVEVIELHHTHNGYCEACPEVARLRLEEERRKAEAATVVDPYADMHVGDWIPAWHKPLEDASGLKFLQGEYMEAGSVPMRPEGLLMLGGIKPWKEWNIPFTPPPTKCVIVTPRSALTWTPVVPGSVAVVVQGRRHCDHCGLPVIDGRILGSVITYPSHPPSHALSPEAWRHKMLHTALLGDGTDIGPGRMSVMTERLLQKMEAKQAAGGESHNEPESRRASLPPLISTGSSLYQPVEMQSYVEEGEGTPFARAMMLKRLKASPGKALFTTAVVSPSGSIRVLSSPSPSHHSESLPRLHTSPAVKETLAHILPRTSAESLGLSRSSSFSLANESQLSVWRPESRRSPKAGPKKHEQPSPMVRHLPRLAGKVSTPPQPEPPLARTAFSPSASPSRSPSKRGPRKALPPPALEPVFSECDLSLQLEAELQLQEPQRPASREDAAHRHSVTGGGSVASARREEEEVAAIVQAATVGQEGLRKAFLSPKTPLPPASPSKHKTPQPLPPVSWL